MAFPWELTRLRTWALALPLALAFCASATVAQAAIIFGHAADAEINPADAKFSETEEILRVGEVPAGLAENRPRNAIFVFDLTGVGTITGATLDLFFLSKRGNPQFNADLWGVGYSDVASDFPSTATFNDSGTDPVGTNLLIHNDFVGPTDTIGEYLSSSTIALVNYLNARTDDFVFFRLSQDEVVGSGNTFYRFISADGPSDQLPRLTLTFDTPRPEAIPEPASMALWGLLSLMGICFWRRQAIGLCLGRTSPNR